MAGRNGLGERFERPGLIGEGSYGEVYWCYDTQLNSTVAVKRILFESETHDGLPSVILREISMLKELDHPNVVRLLDVIVDPAGVSLVLEYLSHDLCQFINDNPGMSPQLIKNILFQILQGVSYCHSQKIMHRDLKLDNILLNPQTTTVKIADFGHSRTFEADPSEYSVDVATISYRAPELLLSRRQTTTAVDIWPVGCIFAEMLNGERLFGIDTEEAVLRRIIRIFGVPSEDEWEGVTADCLKILNEEALSPHRIKLATIVSGLDPKGLDLLSKMLCFLPSKRINALDALNHPYFEDLRRNQ